MAGADTTGPGEALAGPGRSTVETSTDEKEFHVLSSSSGRRCARQCRSRRGARIWIRGTTCDGLHNCTTRQAGPFRGAAATPRVRLELSGYPGHVFHLKVHLAALANSYRGVVRLEAWNGHAYRLFQTVRVPFGGTVTARERVPTAGRYRLRARLLTGPLWHASTSSLVVRVV